MPIQDPNKNIHFIGIGGAGMFPLAMLLKRLGFANITGSNVGKNTNTKLLQEEGIEVCCEGQKAVNIKADNALIVTTNVIKEDNPEIVEAKLRKLNIVKRSDLLSLITNDFDDNIVVSGCHGKTTVTAVISELLANINNSKVGFVSGGKVKAFNSSYRFKSKKHPIIIEADESDGLMVNYRHKVGILLNIEPEHMETYGHSLQNLISAFYKYAINQKDGGCLLVCADCPIISKYLIPMLKQYRASSNSSFRYLTFGLGGNADFHASNISYNKFGNEFNIIFKNKSIRVKTDLLGKHGVHNALCSFAVAQIMGFDSSKIESCVGQFSGAGKRFEVVFQDEDMVLIDDYAHHPTEINATREALRQRYPDSNIHIIWEPHKYSRLADHYFEFGKSLEGFTSVTITPVFACGQVPFAGRDLSDFAKMMSDLSSVKVLEEIDIKDIIASVSKNRTGKKDILLFASAGQLGSLLRSFLGRS